MRGAPVGLAAVLAALVLAGCSSGDGSSSPGSTTRPASSASLSPSAATPTASADSSAGATASVSGQPGQDVAAIAVSIAGGKVSPKPRRVEVREGALVVLTVASDQPDQIHVHGYDLEASVAPGKPATLRFTADQIGLFEVETHESGKLLFQLLVR